MKNIIFAALCLIFLWTQPASAADSAAPMPKPPEVSTYVTARTAYGQATLHKLFMKIYDSALWTDAKTWSMNHVFALSIRYGMNFTVKELSDRSFEEMAHAAPVSKEQRAAFAPQLARAFHDVHPGDVITAVFLPGRGAVFYYNGLKTATLTDIAFAKRFFDIWLGVATTEPELRRQLLALK
jgi:hypothetical protein